MDLARRKSPLVPLLLAAALVLAHGAVWRVYLGGFLLDLGTIDMPTPRFFLLAAMLAFLGLPLVACVAVAGLRLLGPERLTPWRTAWSQYPDRRTLALAGLFGVLVPLAIRSAVLRHAPVADDEASYLFAARLLASFRLWVPSPPMKLFFDNPFLVNDGKMYSQYFLGWPFLLAFGAKFGVPWLVNPLLSGATAVAVFLVARGWWGSAWARVAVVLYLASPLLMTGAATMMSHTAVIFAVSWALYFIQRVEHGAGARDSALAAFFLCLAFWARPATAVGLGAPLAVLWALRVWKQGGRARAGHAVAFGLVVVPLAGAFLLVNQALTGSPWVTGYHAAVRYLRANDFRFVPFSRSELQNESFLYFFTHRSPLLILAKFVVAMFRLSVDSFGWPFGLALAFLARGAPARWLAASAAGLCLVHIPLGDAGIDSFGPVHYSELMLPLVLLSTAGLRTAWGWASAAGLPGLVPSVLAGLLCVCATMYLPPRWGTLALLAADINTPREFVEESAPDGAILFNIQPSAPPCAADPARHFVYFRPNNRPDLSDRVLWVNHVSLKRDREFLRRFPGRPGFLLRVSRNDCEPRLVPLDEATEEQFPPAVSELPTDFPAEAR